MFKYRVSLFGSINCTPWAKSPVQVVEKAWWKLPFQQNSKRLTQIAQLACNAQDATGYVEYTQKFRYRLVPLTASSIPCDCPAASVTS